MGDPIREAIELLERMASRALAARRYAEVEEVAAVLKMLKVEVTDG